MNIEEAKEFLIDQEFTFAKSYADTFPHTYLQRKKCNNEDKYEMFLSLIRSKGIVYTFFSKQYVYLEIDGFVYWEVGRPIKCVQVLNKAPKETLVKNNQKIAYKDIAKELLDKLKHREQYLDNLLKKESPTEVDLMQIEFLTDTQRRIHGGGKNIIDNYKIEVRYE